MPVPSSDVPHPARTIPIAPSVHRADALTSCVALLGQTINHPSSRTVLHRRSHVGAGAIIAGSTEPVRTRQTIDDVTLR